MPRAIKINKKEIARLEKAIDQGLAEFGIELGEIVKERQVIPKKTGDLERSQTVTHIGKNHIQISYSEEYSHKLYYNEEGLTIHRANLKGKANKDETIKDANGKKIVRNRWARDHWLEEILYSKNNKEILAKYIKGIYGYSTSKFKPKEKTDKQAQVETPKPVEKLVEKPAASTNSTRPAWQRALDNKARGLDAGGRPARPPGGPMVRPAGPRPKPKN